MAECTPLRSSRASPRRAVTLPLEDEERTVVNPKFSTMAEA
jgi:hypothetical protein